jgi:hypothetical protein
LTETFKKLGLKVGKTGEKEGTPVDDFLVNYEFYDN